MRFLPFLRKTKENKVVNKSKEKKEIISNWNKRIFIFGIKVSEWDFETVSIEIEDNNKVGY